MIYKDLHAVRYTECLSEPVPFSEGCVVFSVSLSKWNSINTSKIKISRVQFSRNGQLILKNAEPHAIIYCFHSFCLTVLELHTPQLWPR